MRSNEFPNESQLSSQDPGMFYAVHYEAHWTLQDQYYQLQSLVPLVDNPNHRFDSGQGEGLESDMFDLLEQQIMQPDEIRGPVQTFHRHTLPWETHSEKSSGTSIPSMVGTKGMPLPAPRPRGPKLKFTPEDDKLVIDLKEGKDLTWKQIAEFFPGRSAGTLQVRYCTKLKAKTTQWTDRAIRNLRTALHDYEQGKWHIIAQNVGTGFTSAGCKEKAQELEGEHPECGP